MKQSRRKFLQVSSVATASLTLFSNKGTSSILKIMGPTLYQWENQPSDQPVPLTKVIDLTNKVDKDGKLNWNVPAGKWKIKRLTNTNITFKKTEKLLSSGLMVR